MSMLRHFADGRILSELSAQKTTNHKLHKAYLRERNRANELKQNARGRTREIARLKKRVAELEDQMDRTLGIVGDGVGLMGET